MGWLRLDVAKLLASSQILAPWTAYHASHFGGTGKGVYLHFLVLDACSTMTNFKESTWVSDNERGSALGVLSLLFSTVKSYVFPDHHILTISPLQFHPVLTPHAHTRETDILPLQSRIEDTSRQATARRVHIYRVLHPLLSAIGTVHLDQLPLTTRR